MTTARTASTRKAREENGSPVNAVLEQARTPLFAAFGAGDLAAQAVRDVLLKARAQVTGGAETGKGLPTDLAALRERLGPTELRKAIDQYADAAVKTYHRLAAHGEDAYEKLREQPQIKRALEQLEGVAASAQARVDSVTGEVIGKVTRQTRAAGEKTARATERATAKTAGVVEGSGEETAREVRSATRKAASKTAPSSTRRTTTRPAKSSGDSKSS